MEKNVSIIIVGAGISGFTAAVKLMADGFTNVTILEAEDRFGGRIFTTDFSEGLIDLGAQWCHGMDGNIVYELAGDDSFAETRMNFSRMTFQRSDGSSADKEKCERLMELCDKILGGFTDEEEGTVEDLLTKKFHDALDGDEFRDIPRSLALEVLENFKKRECSYCGCDELSKISIDGFKSFKDCYGPTWLNWKGKGYKTIFGLVQKKFNVATSDIEKRILLKKKVVNINWSDKVEVQCADGSNFAAEHVIVTVSLGVLKQNHATMFTPELPRETRTMISEVPFGAVGKIFLEFDEKFWPDDWVGLSLLWVKEDLADIAGSKFPWVDNIYCFYIIESLPNVLLGRLAGYKIDQMESTSDESMKVGCEFVLDRFWPNRKKTKIVKVQTSKWKTNKNFLGTYSYRDSSTKCLDEPIKGSDGKLKILFAGEATHEYFFSTVHGAIETGIREAQRLIEIYS